MFTKTSSIGVQSEAYGKCKQSNSKRLLHETVCSGEYAKSFGPIWQILIMINKKLHNMFRILRLLIHVPVKRIVLFNLGK